VSLIPPVRWPEHPAVAEPQPPQPDAVIRTTATSAARRVPRPLDDRTGAPECSLAEPKMPIARPWTAGSEAVRAPGVPRRAPPSGPMHG
jgi:hypothetical protein